MNHDEQKERENWGKYWTSTSLKKRLIEFLRKIYFSSVFTREITGFTSPGARVLEAGCGSGKYLGLLKKKKFDCWGLDYSRESGLKTVEQIGPGRFILGDIKKLPVRRRSFDLVYNQGVMEHFTDEEFGEILDEMKEAAKKVVIIVPSNLSVFRIYDPIGDDSDKRFFSKKEILKLMSAKLKNVKVRYMWETGFLSLSARGEANS